MVVEAKETEPCVFSNSSASALPGLAVADLLSQRSLKQPDQNEDNQNANNRDKQMSCHGVGKSTFKNACLLMFPLPRMKRRNAVTYGNCSTSA